MKHLLHLQVKRQKKNYKGGTTVKEIDEFINELKSYKCQIGKIEASIYDNTTIDPFIMVQWIHPRTGVAIEEMVIFIKDLEVHKSNISSYLETRMTGIDGFHSQINKHLRKANHYQEESKDETQSRASLMDSRSRKHDRTVC